jgi:hypothetical protein
VILDSELQGKKFAFLATINSPLGNFRQELGIITKYQFFHLGPTAHSFYLFYHYLLPHILDFLSLSPVNRPSPPMTSAEPLATVTRATSSLRPPQITASSSPPPPSTSL